MQIAFILGMDLPNIKGKKWSGHARLWDLTTSTAGRILHVVGTVNSSSASLLYKNISPGLNYIAICSPACNSVTNRLRGLQRSLNLVHYVTESLNLYLKTSVCTRKLENFMKSRFNKSLNLKWIHKDLKSHIPFLPIVDRS